MTIYYKDGHTIINTTGGDIVIEYGNRDEKTGITHCVVNFHRPGKIGGRNGYDLPYTLPLSPFLGQRLTDTQCEALVEAIAAAERAGKSFITVSGGEVVEDQSEGARHGVQ